MDAQTRLSSLGIHLKAGLFSHLNETKDPSIMSSYPALLSWLLNMDWKQKYWNNEVMMEPMLAVVSSSHMVITGPMVLQIQTIVNVSQSSASQYDFYPSNHRMLCFKLTDGYTTVIGIEHQSLRESMSLFPGRKIQLLNAIEVSNGKLLLTRCLKIYRQGC